MDGIDKTRRFDWVTLFWLKDGPRDFPDRAKDFVAALDYFKRPDGGWEGDYDYYLSPGGDGRQTFHKIEVWGRIADLFAQLLSPQDWLLCSRLDYRQELSERSDRDMRYFVLWQMRRGAKRVNLYPMDTRPRKKTNKRDVGGKGIFLGSRKSDKTLAVYKRGAEMPACEFRLMNEECRALVAHTMERQQSKVDGDISPYECLRQRWDNHAAARLLELTGFETADMLIDRAVKEWTEIERIIAAVNVAERMANGQLNFWDVMARLAITPQSDPEPIDAICPQCHGDIEPGVPCEECMQLNL